MAYNFLPFKQSVKGVEDWLKRELSGIRTGRANSSLLDNLKVEVYGNPMPLNQVSSILAEGSQTLRINPWDTSAIKPIEKAIITSDLGLSASVDDKGVRVTFPELTSDRRAALIKVVKQKLEDARVTLRAEREKVIKDIDKKEKEGGMSEDEKFRLKAELQKILDDCNKILEESFAKKEKEIGE